jgi:hypothetical protein
MAARSTACASSLSGQNWRSWRGCICALQRTGVPARRRCWISRARSTRCRIAAEGSPSAVDIRSSCGRRGTST